MFLVVYALVFNGGGIAIELQSNMNFAITTILGGYFGDQIVQHWQRHKEEEYEKETI